MVCSLETQGFPPNLLSIRASLADLCLCVCATSLCAIACCTCKQLQPACTPYPPSHLCHTRSQVRLGGICRFARDARCSPPTKPSPQRLAPFKKALKKNLKYYIARSPTDMSKPARKFAVGNFAPCLPPSPPPAMSKPPHPPWPHIRALSQQWAPLPQPQVVLAGMRQLPDPPLLPAR